MQKNAMANLAQCFLAPGVEKRVKRLATTMSRKPRNLLFFVRVNVSDMKCWLIYVKWLVSFLYLLLLLF